jgi:hypothetical protein
MNAIAASGAPASGCAEERAQPVDERGAEARQAVAIEWRDLRAEVAADDLSPGARPIVIVI